MADEVHEIREKVYELSRDLGKHHGKVDLRLTQLEMQVKTNQRVLWVIVAVTAGLQSGDLTAMLDMLK